MTCFFGVSLDVLYDALHERVTEPLLDALLAPREVLFGPAGLARVPVGERREAFGCVGRTVEEDVLDRGQQLLRDLVVHRQRASIDDAHVHARLNRVVEKRRMHRFASGIAAAVRE